MQLNCCCLLACLFLEKAEKITRTEYKIVSHTYLVWSATKKISHLVDNTRSLQKLSRHNTDFLVQKNESEE